MRVLALFLLLAVACTNGDKQPLSGDSPPIDGGSTLRPPLVPVDADGWPIGWPRAGVLFIGKKGQVIDYAAGPESNPAAAERWIIGAMTPEQEKMSDEASRRSRRNMEWLE